MKATFKIKSETFFTCNQSFRKCTGEDLSEIFKWETAEGNTISAREIAGWIREFYKIELNSSRGACHDTRNGVGAFLSHLISHPELITDLKQHSIVDIPFFIKKIIWSDDLIIDALNKSPTSFCINEADCDQSGLEFLNLHLTIIPTEIKEHRVILGLALRWMGRKTPFRFGSKISPVNGIKHFWFQRMEEMYDLMYESNIGIAPDSETIYCQLHTEIYDG